MVEPGLTDKYRVERVDGRPIEWCFVLEVQDPLARMAITHYAVLARGAGKEQLAQDLFNILHEYAEKMKVPPEQERIKWVRCWACGGSGWTQDEYGDVSCSVCQERGELLVPADTEHTGTDEV